MRRNNNYTKPDVGVYTNQSQKVSDIYEYFKNLEITIGEKTKKFSEFIGDLKNQNNLQEVTGEMQGDKAHLTVPDTNPQTETKEKEVYTYYLEKNNIKFHAIEAFYTGKKIKFVVNFETNENAYRNRTLNPKDFNWHMEIASLEIKNEDNAVNNKYLIKNKNTIFNISNDNPIAKITAAVSSAVPNGKVF